jgi:DNA-directed RNA polymerase subunit beta'
MTIVVQSESGMEKEHHVPQDKHLLVHAGDVVDAGDPLIEGPLIPHDILRIKGEEALQQYLLAEVQAVYRSQNVTINDKHLEVIINQMIRKVKVEQPGDSRFLPGEVVDKFRFRAENETLVKSVVVSNAGDTKLQVGEVVTKAELSEASEEAEANGGEPAKGKRPRPASGTTLLLGITKASLSSESFISSASFQETTKVLTEAALGGQVDELQGLKENVILGHLIPAGSAFRRYQRMRVKHLGEPIPVLPEVAEIAMNAPMAESLASSGVFAGVTPLSSLGGVDFSGGLDEENTLSDDVPIGEIPSSETEE